MASSADSKLAYVTNAQLKCQTIKCNNSSQSLIDFHTFSRLRMQRCKRSRRFGKCSGQWIPSSRVRARTKCDRSLVLLVCPSIFLLDLSVVKFQNNDGLWISQNAANK